MPGWVVVAIAIIYLLLLFAIASYGDRPAGQNRMRRGRPLVYALAISVYCTSWTFFGSVGLAATSGLDFLTIYIGAGLMIAFGYPVLQRIVTVSKAQNITSIADFLSARYGKNQTVGTVVTLIVTIGVVPYIALQLKAVSLSLATVLEFDPNGVLPNGTISATAFPISGDIALLVALVLALFAILFGTRQIDATEHQDGLILAVAAESIVKLVAFIAVGLFITYGLFEGFGDIWAQTADRPEIRSLFLRDLDGSAWMAMCFLSLTCIILLPRQFHVLVVENYHSGELKRARWLFPLYLVAINLFVVPIAIAGLITFEGREIDYDMLVLLLPLEADAAIFTLLAFVGGFSAATAMVIVSTVALSIMICNEIAVPMILRRRNPEAPVEKDMGHTLLAVRRSVILVVLLLAYAYYRVSADEVALASIGLLSFSAIAQLAPAFFGGLFWRRATARGALAGMTAGFTVWSYTLLLPSLARAGLVSSDILTEGPFGFAFLRPEVLLYLEFAPLTHGIIWTMTVNIAAFVAVSLLRPSEPIERLQAGIFISQDRTGRANPLMRWQSSVSVGDLMRTVSRYLGDERTERAFAEYASRNGFALDRQAAANLAAIRFAENLLASAIGAASSRIVLSLLLKRENVSPRAALKLLDDASSAIQYNRGLLQTALDQVGQGIAAFDRDLRLISWNRQFRGLLGLPQAFGIVGTPLHDIVRFLAEKGEFGEGPPDALIDSRIEKIVIHQETFLERLSKRDLILEVRINPMPEGGIVITFTDITDRVKAQEGLAQANANLEKRVRQRTEELERLNRELGLAKAEAEDANRSKTRFLAAAGHDVMQPLNAARLYNSSLLERDLPREDERLARNIEASLEAAEDILGALLDISRLDTGALKPELSSFPMDDLLEQIVVEFLPSAEDKNLDLRVVRSSLSIRSDRRLLRRVLHNLVSNAVKYTTEGRVLVGCRRKGRRVEIMVCDTGPGIAPTKQSLVFEEFQRLNETREPGLGLGLSIVKRMCGVLDHGVTVRSVPRRGSVFSVSVPHVPAGLPRAANDEITARMPRARPVRGTDNALEGLSVVCIDNDPRILDSMESLLLNWGCYVTTGTTAREVISEVQAKGRPIDIALIDYHLDDASGFDALKSLRWTLDGALPAVLITADRSPPLKAQADTIGLPVLSKPVKPAALRAVMQRTLVQRPSAAE